MTASAELQLLDDAAASLLTAHFPVSRLRAAISDDQQHEECVCDLRQRAAELGWFGFLVPEELGGGSLAGHGIVDAVLVARQRGRHLAPGPFADLHVAATAIAASGTAGQREDVLPDLSSGEQAVACAFGTIYDSPQCAPLRLAGTPDGIVLDGQARPVVYAATARTLLVWAADAGQVRRFLVPADSVGLAIRPLEGLDLTARAAEVTFASVLVPPAAELIASDPGPAIRADLAVGALLTAADSVGAMDQLLEMTVDYARNRHAFGRAIGSFQAVKHQLADLSMLVQASKAVTDAATEAIAGGHRDAAEIASIAKAFVSEHSHAVGQGCLQLHGGIGYAWEHDLHLYLRRLAANGVTYGSARQHRAAIASLHLGQVTAARSVSASSAPASFMPAGSATASDGEGGL
jgi:alkylation response protein AidB-like acyl-CoA dehydrogenase